jgi:hypothetical protein
MSLGGALYLAMVVCAFLIFAGTLFWGMVATSRGAGSPLAYRGDKPGEAEPHHDG